MKCLYTLFFCISRIFSLLQSSINLILYNDKYIVFYTLVSQSSISKLVYDQLAHNYSFIKYFFMFASLTYKLVKWRLLQIALAENLLVWSLTRYFKTNIFVIFLSNANKFYKCFYTKKTHLSYVCRTKCVSAVPPILTILLLFT